MRIFNFKLSETDLYIILILAFFLRAFFFFMNSDSVIYTYWAVLFKDALILPNFDHPPLFLLLSYFVLSFFNLISKLGAFYWTILAILLFIIISLKLKLYLKILLILILVYSFVVGRFFSSYEILTLISLYFALLRIYFTFKFGERLFNKEVGIVASFLLAFSFWDIIYSKVNLIDGAATTLFLASIYYYLEFLKKNSIFSKEFVFTAIFIVLALYSKYYNLLLLIFLSLLAMLMKKNHVKAFLPLTFSLTFLPWLIYTNFYFLNHFANKHYFFLVYPSIASFLYALYLLLSPPIFILFLISIASFCVKGRKKENFFVFVTFLLPFLFYFYQSFFEGKAHPLINFSNYMLPSLPFIILLVSNFICGLSKKVKIKIATMLLLVILFSMLFWPRENIELEYDRNYKTLRGNLDCVKEPEKIKSALPYSNEYELHFVYTFSPYRVYCSPNYTLPYTYRWENATKFLIISDREFSQPVKFIVYNLTSDSKFLKVMMRNEEIARYEIKGKYEMNLTLNLKKGINEILFLSEECKVKTECGCADFLILEN